MEEKVRQLEEKFAQLERRVLQLEMASSAPVPEGLGALRNEFKREIERLENWIKNMRAS